MANQHTPDEDGRSEEKKAQTHRSAVTAMMNARRKIVDVRLDRQTEDKLLSLTSKILDVLEGKDDESGEEVEA